MKKTPLLLLCFCLSSCTGLYQIQPLSREYYALEQGDILSIKTSDGKKHKVKFIGIGEDSIYAYPTSFVMDSVAVIEKEKISAKKTAALVGGVFAGAGLATMLIFLVIADAYLKSLSVL